MIRAADDRPIPRRRPAREGRAARHPEPGRGDERRASPPSDFLTPRQVAEAMAVSRDVVMRWIALRHLRAVNVSSSLRARKKRWRVRREDLEEFVKIRTSAPAPRIDRRRRKPDYERIV